MYREFVDPTFFITQAEFRRWLRANHAKTNELLVGFYKKDSGRGGITYPEALDAALCFGWIDGVRRNLDSTSYTIRFSPRKPGSIWSVVNTNRMQILIDQKQVHASGLAAFEKRDRDKTKLYSYEERSREMDPPYKEKLLANPKAAEYFNAQSPYYRRMASWFVMSAKQDQTREKRLTLLIDCCERGERLPQSQPGKKP